MPMMVFKAFLSHFSGFSSPDWALLISSPQLAAARGYAKEEAAEGGLDARNYMKIFEEIDVGAKQRSLLAQKIAEFFFGHLAASMRIPAALQFDQYDSYADRIVVTIPLPTVWRLAMRSGQVSLAPLLGAVQRLKDGLAEPDPSEPDPAVNECLRRLSPSFLRWMLGSCVEAEVEKQMLKKLTGAWSNTVFGQSVDWDKFDSMVADRRYKKMQNASAVANGPASQPACHLESERLRNLGPGGRQSSHPQDQSQNLRPNPSNV